MSNPDDLLQRELASLENGQPVQQVLNNLPPEAQDLAALIALAGEMRSVPPPLAPSGLRQKVLTAAADVGAPPPPLDLAGRRQRRTSASMNVPPPLSTRASRGFSWPRLAFALLAVFAFGMLLIWRAAPVGAQTARVTDVRGPVEASLDNGDWQSLASGDTVHAGQQVRTLDGAAATLVFYEGSRTTLGSNTSVTLAGLNGSWGRTLQVVLDQASGQTAHSVVPFKGKSSQFIVNGPTGAASVHGTQFNVAVYPQGETRFAVSSGRVLVYNDHTQSFVNAGQTTLALADAKILDPLYQFSVRGALQSIEGSTWVVEGVTFQVDANTSISGSFFVGDLVDVEGRILADGTRRADRISAAQEGDSQASLTGKVEATGEPWRVGGQELWVTPETEIADGVEIGAVVEVSFTVLPDGRWQASEIALLEKEPQPIPEDDARSLVFQPDDLNANGCGGSFTFDSALFNTGAQATSAALDSAVLRGAEYVESVTIAPASFDSLAPGASGAFRVQVNTTAAYGQTKGNQKQIKVRVFVASASGQQTNHLTITIIANCQRDATATLTRTPGDLTTTPTLTLTATLTPSATPAGTETVCTGNTQHPTGLELAARYGVSYEEIMGWFCQHFGFGEIDLVYTLSQQSGKPVEEIFAMRQAGMGWGNIKKQLAPTAELKPTKEIKPTKQPNPNKPEAKPTKKPKKN